ncbi:hypothetical protein V8E36_006852 [Tilletia maclaganii]
MEITFSGSGSDMDSVPTSDEELIFLFRLAPGLALTSNAAHLARVFLVPEAIIERSQQVAELARTHNLAALLLEEEEGAAETEPQTSAATDDTLSDGSGRAKGRNEFSSHGHASKASSSLSEAEDRIRKFLEWDLEAEQEEGTDEVEHVHGYDSVRQKLAEIMT